MAADRAGAGTSLLAAWSPNSNTKALAYQVRPVELLALVISFVVTGKTAETDYIFITGTDAWGAAQTESIDVSAGNGTYVTTKRFRTITNIDCSDNAAGVGTVWADGTVAMTQPIWGVIWNKGNGQYQLDCGLVIGDGFISTYFKTLQNQIAINLDQVAQYGTVISVKANAYLIDGEVINEVNKTTRKGSHFLIYGARSGFVNFDIRGSYLYSTTITINSPSQVLFPINGATIWNFISTNNLQFGNISGTNNLYNILLQNSPTAIRADYTNFTIDKITVQGASTLLWITSAGIGIIKNLVGRDNGTDIYAHGITQARYFINCDFGRDAWVISADSNPTANIYRQYELDLHVVDLVGNLPGATVALKDKNGTPCFSAVTDADGRIVRQTVTRIIYDHNNAFLPVDYGPFVLTITKPGYQTYTDILTIDRKMDLEVALGPVPPPVYMNVPSGEVAITLSAPESFEVSLEAGEISVELSDGQ